jgi:hypothetical protein
MIKTSCVAAALALAAGGICGTSPAWAEQPAVRGCVGFSVSDAAHHLRPVGQFFSDLARDPYSHPGISDNVHTLAAAGYTDEEIPNTCNG